MAWADEPVVRDGDVPIWANILIAGDMPIVWESEEGEIVPGNEPAGRIVIGSEEQVKIDLCGGAVARLLKVVAGAYREAGVPLPADLVWPCAGRRKETT